MNCASLFLEHARATPNHPAIWLPNGGSTSFGDLARLAGNAQRLCREHGVGPGDTVLAFDGLGPRLYALVAGCLALGVRVVMVDPWMNAASIEHALGLVQPKLFVGNALGFAWGAKSAPVRRLAHWERASAVMRGRGETPHVEDVAADHGGTVTFTTGTTGQPKGVVRTHGTLTAQLRILGRTLGVEGEKGPDLCFFAAFVLANLATGRTSVVIPSVWSRGALRHVDGLPDALQPVTFTCGPAILARLVEETVLRKLRGGHIGGALADTSLYLRALQRWPNASFSHVYGSTEAEPVAHAELRTAVRKSEDKGLWQTLYLGHPVETVNVSAEATGLWVDGPHVCPAYLGDAQQNRDFKRVDARGVTWHNMNDRVRSEPDGLWFGGRMGQSPEDFALEQQIYAFLGRSRAFLHRDRRGRCVLVGEDVARCRKQLRARFSELDAVFDARIVTDRRHRARIDRKASAAPYERWGFFPRLCASR